MKKRGVKIVLIAAAVAIALELILQGYVAVEMKKRSAAPGNDARYDVEKLEKHGSSALSGKRILFLGSSVTFGAAAEGQSFVELFSGLDGVNAVKEAKSGTTLVDSTSILALVAFGNGDSYVKRLRKLDTDISFDCVVCQLSTNDATMKLPLGEIGDDSAKTITGAMEYIIQYCRDTWGCPVVFYTGSYYESPEYAAMVDRLYELKDKWDIGVIDLYTDAEFNAIDKSAYDFYMYDEIHPTKAGYIEWWMPKLEAELVNYLETEVK